MERRRRLPVDLLGDTRLTRSSQPKRVARHSHAPSGVGRSAKLCGHVADGSLRRGERRSRLRRRSEIALVPAARALTSRRGERTCPTPAAPT